MDELKNIFGIELDVDLYVRSANSVVPLHLKTKINNRCKENILAVEKFDETDVYVPKILDMADIKKRFIDYCKYSKSPDFTSIELKKMCYFADEIASIEEEYSYLIDLFKSNWKDSFLNGLIYFILSKWDNLEYDIKTKLFKEFILEKISDYDGNKHRFLKAKENIIYLREGGATKLGQKLKVDKIRIIHAPQAIGQKDSTLVFSYFSKVIQAFYYKDYLNHEDLDEVLSTHSSLNTSKIVLSDKINYVSSIDKLDEIDTLKALALEHIGDPSINSKWGTTGMDDESAIKVKLAHEKVNRWVIQMYINVVFSKLIEDPRRRVFWLKYVDHITSFKVIGSPLIRQILASDSLLSYSLKYYFKQTVDERTKSTCSMLITIKDHYFIEFSDLGALYVYEKSNHSISKLLNGNIGKIEDLKTSQYHNLVEPGYYIDTCNNDGKMVHRGMWEDRLKNWFNKTLDIDVSSKTYKRRG